LKKLAIVGAQKLTRNNAPFEDDDFDIWTISNWGAADWCKRADAVIEIHKPSVYTDHPTDRKYWAWLQKTKTPVYMLDLHPNIESATLYPLDEIQATLKNITVHGDNIQNFGSSLDYSLALAIYQGYTHIEIYGVEMAHSSEYRSQQASFAFWVGVATGRGVAIDLRCTNKLFDRPLYGRQSNETEKIINYIDGLKAQKAEQNKQTHMVDGALGILKQLLEEG